MPALVLQDPCSYFAVLLYEMVYSMCVCAQRYKHILANILQVIAAVTTLAKFLAYLGTYSPCSTV
jgi:hypothetical protein